MPDLGFSPRCYIGTAQKDSLVLVFGGLDASNTILNTFDRINIDSWSSLPLTNFSASPRKGGMAFVANELFYYTTGVSQTNRLDETWRIGNVLEKEELKESDFQIFPNPCSDFCRIDFKAPFSGVLFLYSIDGRMVQEFNLTNSNLFEMNTKDYVGGTYILRAETITELLLIQK